MDQTRITQSLLVAGTTWLDEDAFAGVGALAGLTSGCVYYAADDDDVCRLARENECALVAIAAWHPKLTALLEDLTANRLASVVFGGEGREDVRVAAFAAGAGDFIASPFSPGELRGRVSAVLRWGTPHTSERWAA